MARSFDGTNDFLSIPTQPFAGVPCTMAAWFRLNNVSGVKSLVAAGGLTVSNQVQEYAILVNNAAFWALTQSNTNTQAIATATLAPNTWYHGCGVFASQTDRRAFINGQFKGTDTTSKLPVGTVTSRTCIGQRANTLNDQKLAGLCAEVAIWQAALSDTEVAYLATGVLPFRVRPERLVSYWSLRACVLPEQNTGALFRTGATAPASNQINMAATGAPKVAQDPPHVLGHLYEGSLQRFVPMMTRSYLPATPVKTRSFIVIMG